MPHQQIQQAQQAAQAVASKLGQGGGGFNNMQNKTVPNPEAVQKAKELISKFSNQFGGQMGGQTSPTHQPSGMGRPGLGATTQEEIMVPGNKVGLIIGKGGETIKQLQEKTGAKMVVVQDGPTQEMEKPLRISGDPAKVEHAKQLVFELIGGDQTPNPRAGGGGGGFNNRGGGGGNNMAPRGQQEHNPNYGYGNGGGPHNESIELFVPKIAVGVVIGKGGDMIKKIQAETGCKLQFIQQSKNEEQGDRRCMVSGTKQQVDDGKRMIEDLITSVMKKNSGNYGNDSWNGNSYGQQAGSAPIAGGVQVQQEQYQFIVPSTKCGIIIGRNGDTIKQINQQSGAHCEMDRKASQNQTTEKTFTIKGEQHQVDEAKRLIQDKINMDLNLVHLGTQTVTQPANGGFGGQNAQGYWPGGYGAAQGWDQSQAAMAGAPGGPQIPGQPDYSAQWIEYYRSMGMHREAEAIEAQIKQRQPAAPTPGKNFFKLV
jgi:far upstream element-binding protein